MPQLIAIRLLPEKPVTAEAFTEYLNGLSVIAFDASFVDPGAAEPASRLEEAGYFSPTIPLDVSPTDEPIHDPNTRIVQHFGLNPTNPLDGNVMLSVGTALIEVPDAGLAVEHETFDLRITIERAGATILHKRRYFNVPVRPGSLPADPVDYPSLMVDGQPFVSLYLYLPPPGLETGGELNVPEDGTAPNFDQLKAAVEQVLNDDPGNTSNIDDLTPIQARHVAAEIVWDRSARPLPAPDMPLELMYTEPPGSDSGPERVRAGFEGDLKTYQVGNDATAERLANFVFTFSAALHISSELTLPARGDAAALTVPVNAPDLSASARIKLSGIAAITPFEVPADYIYALTAVLPLQVNVERRFDMILMGDPSGTVSTLEEALHNQIIVADPTVSIHQAARRLAAVGRAREPALPECSVVGEVDVQTLVNGWLNHSEPDIDDFWTSLSAGEQSGHFDLVLCAVTKDYQVLINALTTSTPPITSLDDLRTAPDAFWQDLFASDPSLLPPFTHPGSLAEQTRTFLRHLRRFFEAAVALDAPAPSAPGVLPLLDPPVDDLISALGAIDLETFDPVANVALLDALFPDDPERRAQFEAWLECLRSALSLSAGIAPAPLRFSVTEALWARGFVTSSDFDGFDLDTFIDALVGTVAHDHASTIFANAAAGGAGITEPAGPFAPVNPWGALTNCIPPKHLSPLGPVAYLKEVLQVSEAATCDEPLASNEGSEILGAALSERRGPISDLLASHTNVCIPIPLIDIVNESLERVVVNIGLPGAIHDTTRDELAGHVLDTHPAPPDDTTIHDAQTLFCALPEHSTPATPTAEQAAWVALANDFSSCHLPYNQPLDVTRSYLTALGTSRFATMRSFTREIHAFVHAPDIPPDDFRNQLWRYPVRLPLALDYLCISQEEHALLFSPGMLGPAALPQLFGIPDSQRGVDDSWMGDVQIVSVFLEKTCLDYCDFRDLVLSGYVDIVVSHRQEEVLPECEPCCLEEHRITFAEGGSAFGPLKRLIVFIRLWRTLQSMPNSAYSFAELADIATVLALFSGNTVNGDFIRQVAAFQMFRDDFDLRLTDPLDPLDSPSASATGAARTHLLAFWVAGAQKSEWALEHLLSQIQQYAMQNYQCPCRPPEFLKLLRRNLNPLSRLVGFDPDTPGREWNAQPTHTLRMAEILAKIYASRFQVGELLFLFTADPQIQGGDPFPAQTDNEARDLSFDLPDNEAENALFALRDALLAVEFDEDGAVDWNWPRMGDILREVYGLPDSDTRWTELGTHFFPDILEAQGSSVASTSKVWREALPSGATSSAMWNTPEGPFRHVDDELEVKLPLVDSEVITKLARIRSLNPQERSAVSSLYMAPRKLLGFFAFLFENQLAAESALIEEPDPTHRWNWFRANFARFHARSQAIATHVAAHLDRVTGDVKSDGVETAMLLLRHLWADENTALGSWENDTGAVPGVSWSPRPNGGAFHALHGVVGTGMIAEYRGAGPLLRWRETRGGIDAFGPSENAVNGPLPTLIPAMDSTLDAEQLRYVTIRNGFAMGNEKGLLLGGAEPFTLTWRGVLLIEESGKYGFRIGAPAPDNDHPDFDAIRRFHRWRVRLEQGQRSWVLLAHDWPNEEAPDDCADSIHLERGFYDFTIEFERLPLVFDGPEDVCPQVTGLQIKYYGPDAGDAWNVIPHNKLFIGTGKRLDSGLDTGATPGSIFGVLGVRHVVSIRSIRRTLQRLFKAMLFTDRLNLSATPVADSGQSELGYLLSQSEAFSGQSYFDPGGGFQPHRANLDFNLLPVLDNYHPPAAAEDQRVSPTPQRSSALFDWWERLFDYTVMREATGDSPESPAWLLFHEAAELHVDELAQLLRHIGVDIRHVPLVLRYFDLADATHTFNITSTELIDDRWSIRVWHADLWLQALRASFLEADIGTALPHLWAAAPLEMSGTQNLTQFYRDGTIENGEPRRYREIETLNDGLRLRGRDALIAFLTAMDRVTLPWGGFAVNARELSELLLMDVEAGLCEKAARVEEAITAVQLFVDRARLGLETRFIPDPGFALAWDRHFADFRLWQVCKRRVIYRESWIGWSEEAITQGSEAFRFLQSELRRGDLTIPVPGGGVDRAGHELPPHSALALLQKREPATLARLAPPRQGLGLLSTPDRHARPSWLAPIPQEIRSQQPGDPSVLESSSTESHFPNPSSGLNADGSSGRVLPQWFEAAVRLGTKFLRVAAAGLPPGSADYLPKCDLPDPTWCCQECGRSHPAIMDEYYFWIDVSEKYLPIEQVAEWVSEDIVEAGAAGAVDGTGAPIADTVWHDEDALPAALRWMPRRIARLNWCRVHNGEFQPPRRSSEGVLLSETPIIGEPDIEFRGREADSLFLEVLGADPELVSPGFRYDIAPDSATTLPEIVPTEVPALPGGLPAFPWFAFASPGSPILPVKTFGTVVAVAEHLATHCRYEEALKWLELEWAPLEHDNIWAECDRLRPPDSTIPEDDPHDDTNGDPDDHDDEPNEPVPVPDGPVPVLISLEATHDQHPGECCCPSDPVSDNRAERRHAMMLYAEILLSWGEALMRKDAPEAFQRARLLVDTARRILGALPKTVDVGPGDEPAVPIRDVSLACAPLNPRLMCIYTRAEDLLAQIHACLDSRRHKSGKPNDEQPYFLDDRTRKCWQSMGDPCLEAAHWCRRQSPHRFPVLAERARRAASECSSLGAQLLNAFQQGDAEYLSALSTKHQRQIGDLILDIRKDQWREADWGVQALRKSKDEAITNLTYYQNLVAAGLLSGESQYEPLTGTATGLRSAGNVVEAIGQAMNLIPDPNVGVLSFVTLPPGKKLAMVFASMGTVVNVAADIVSTVASLGLTKDGWERREDEWLHQIDVFTIAIDRIEREILANERRRDAALHELNSHRQSMANTAEVHDFLRDKFTSHTLYLWLQKETAALYAQCHELALQCAWDAERAFNFERELSADRFIALNAPDTLHERLLDGERLSLALAKMQKAYEDRDRRPYELTKHISLRQHFPVAFLQLVATGRCVVELPEWLFDLDYPGHYLRRIRTLSVSLPCIVGPYTGVHCKVSLLASSIRVSPEVFEPDHRCCDNKGCNSGYEALPDDPRVVYLHGAAEAIATSTGQNDAGLHNLSLEDPRYLPFEYQGAVCRLCIELPPETNRFDIDTLTDLIVHMRYTAHEGGDVIRRAALDCALRKLPGDGSRFIDAKRELPGQWRKMAAPARHGADSEEQSDYLGLQLERGMFPFLIGNQRPLVNRIELLFEAPNADPSRHLSVILFTDQRLETIKPDSCREGVFTIECVADASWPGFFHGVLDMDPLEVSEREGTSVGVLSFAPEVLRLCDVWLIFGYETTGNQPACLTPESVALPVC